VLLSHFLQVLKACWRKISKDNPQQDFKFKHWNMLCKLEDIIPSPEINGYIVSLVHPCSPRLRQVPQQVRIHHRQRRAWVIRLFDGQPPCLTFCGIAANLALASPSGATKPASLQSRSLDLLVLSAWLMLSVCPQAPTDCPNIPDVAKEVARMTTALVEESSTGQHV
jgi:hypothetical protein